MTPKQLESALARVRLLVLDVDGVMTDGAVWFGATETLHRYDIRDGTGIKYLMRNNIEIAVITGRESESVARYCRSLDIRELCQRRLDKLPAFIDMLERRNLPAEQAAVVGDDLPDLPLLSHAGVGIAVADAHEEVRRHADWITRARGGHGAVREVAEAILKAKGLWTKVLERYLG